MPQAWGWNTEVLFFALRILKVVRTCSLASSNSKCVFYQCYNRLIFKKDPDRVFEIHALD